VNREQKSELVESLHGVFANTSLVVVTHYTGLTVAEMTDLRTKVRAEGASFKVTKNRLTRLALDGTEYGGLADSFKGPTAIAYSDDPVAAAKATVEYAKKNEKLVILCGALGEQLLDADGVKALASLPTLYTQRVKLRGLSACQATQLVRAMQEPSTSTPRVI